jgi:ADP-heptose:LPS heptosyltransferase
MFEEDNVSCFRNKLGDMYNETFLLTEYKRKQKDMEMPWIDDPPFKEMVREKGFVRVAEVTREFNKTR